MLSAISIGLSGLRAAETRLDATASNIANAGTTGEVPGPGASRPVYAPVRVELSEAAGGGVLARPVADTSAYSLAYAPSSPDANAAGIIGTPNVDIVTEAMDLITAKVQYEASARIIKTVEDLQKTALDTLA
jgi:flagellar basal-body rod protein FlgC